MNLFGIGPRIVGGGAFAFAACETASLSLGIFRYPLEYKSCIIVSLIFFLPGAALWLAAAYTVTKGFAEGRLVTTGVFAILRNPLYAAFILFIVPAFSFLLDSWLILLVSLVMYIIFRKYIAKEEEFLSEKFGQAFFDYRSRVSRIIPFID